MIDNMDANIFKKKPSISIVVPLYNKVQSISRALDSILSQTIEDFEVIVVNDGSTDGSERVVETYSDPRVILISQTNQGVSVARNNGILSAHSDIIAFLDADDQWDSNFLETIMDLHKKWPSAGLYGAAYRVITTGGKVYNRIYSQFQEPSLVENYFFVKNKVRWMLISTSGMAISRQAFIDSGGFPIGYNTGEDEFLRAKIALSHTIAYSPVVCSTYYVESLNSQQSNDITSNPFADYIDSQLDGALSCRQDYKDILLFNDRAIIHNVFNNFLNVDISADVIVKQLYRIKSKEKLFVKYSLIVMAYFPLNIRKSVVYLHHQFQNLYRILFRKNNHNGD